MAAGYLAELGHRDIAHLAGPTWSLDANERRRGWRTELERRGLPVRKPLFGDWTSESGYEIGLQLAETEDFTAVFAANDQMALGLLHAFSDSGIRVPADMSVVGFDDVAEAAHFIPPLTTVRQDFIELGRQILAVLLALIEGAEVGESMHAEPELIVRMSTGAPRATTTPKTPVLPAASGWEIPKTPSPPR
jgi:DNA-binding LacI/PurR family transcriptional regulator